MGSSCCSAAPPRTYAVTIHDLNVVLRSPCKRPRDLAGALILAMSTAKPLSDGGYDISELTGLFSDYGSLMEWPVVYCEKVSAAIGVLQHLPAETAVVSGSKSCCVVAVHPYTKFIRVSCTRYFYIIIHSGPLSIPSPHMR